MLLIARAGLLLVALYESVRLTSFAFIIAALYVVVLLTLYLLQHKGARLSENVRQLPECLLGFSLPLVPTLDSKLVLVLGLFLCTTRISLVAIRRARCAFPFLTILFAWLAAELIFGPDVSAVVALFGERLRGTDGALDLYSYLRQVPLFFEHALTPLVRWALAISLYAILYEDPAARVHVSRGVIVGLALALPLTALQVSGVAPELLQHQPWFWTAIHRYSGTFSDPNAFGIFIALSLPILVREVRRTSYPLLFILFGMAWCVLASYAGSRSFFLALFLYSALFVIRSWRQAIWGLLGAVALLLAFGVTDGAIDLSALPEGLQRTAHSLNPIRIRDALYTRSVFLTLGVHIWRDNLMVGAGSGVFPSLVPGYAALLDLGTGMWRDNSNNFYLGILAELGIVGAFAFVIVVSRAHWRTDARRSAGWYGMLVLLLLLLVGPHLNFPEVLVLSVLLLADAVELRPIPISGRAWMPILMAVPLIFLKSAIATHGLYAWERDDGGMFRWATLQSRVAVSCHDDQAEVSARLPQPAIALHPVTLTLRGPNETRSREVHDEATFTEHFPCHGATRLVISLDADRAFVPGKLREKGDNRILALQLRSGTLKDEALASWRK